MLLININLQFMVFREAGMLWTTKWLFKDLEKLKSHFLSIVYRVAAEKRS
jgi:hypothetical protein